MKINLEEIIKKHFYLTSDGSTDVHSSINDVKELLKDFGKQLLKLAAENAEAEYGGTCIDSGGIMESGELYVDKNSILDTINQVE